MDVLFGTHTPTNKGMKSTEKVQHFACKLATKRWDTSYEELLGLLELPTLEERRVHMKLFIVQDHK